METRRTLHPSIKVALMIAVSLLVLPYLVGALSGGEGHTFLGFVFNPKDGLSYLAKMEQGRQGNWLFRLPYTAEPVNGAFLFSFYLFLGHIARWTGLPAVWVFHATRLVAGAFLLYTLWKFAGFYFPDERKQRLAYWLLVFGSGMGWVLFVTGYLSSDFWVAEMYPFFSMLSNPHFPLGMGLMLQMILLTHEKATASMLVKLALVGLGLSVVLPFGFVSVAILLALDLALEAILQKDARKGIPLLFFIPGGCCLLIQYWQVLSDPFLRRWNAQNVTPTPVWWDVFLSLSPAIVLIIAGLAIGMRNFGKKPQRLVWLWVISGLLLAYAPISIQRRFLTGFYIPVAVLGLEGLFWLFEKHQWPIRRGYGLLFGLSIPTHLLLIVVGLFGALSVSPKLYLSAGEAEAMEWIVAHTPQEVVFASSEEIGLAIPALTGRRVILGHPFETPDYETMTEVVGDVFTADQTPEGLEAFSQQHGASYIFWGPREQKMAGEGADPSQMGKLVFENEEVKIIAAGLTP
ncbi:MAG: hypothetical protein GYA48_04545 [Chloroflexi bacterium]|nr:hypothetical protein [Chloroflexota bacterium]